MHLYAFYFHFNNVSIKSVLRWFIHLSVKRNKNYYFSIIVSQWTRNISCFVFDTTAAGTTGSQLYNTIFFRTIIQDVGSSNDDTSGGGVWRKTKIALASTMLSPIIKCVIIQTSTHHPHTHDNCTKKRKQNKAWNIKVITSQN